MLRVSVHDSQSVRIQLEGQLAGPYVREAERCWHEVRARPQPAAVQFDLTGVTQVDESGKALLAAARSQGAELTASGCLMRALVANLSQMISVGTSTNCQRQNGNGNQGGQSEFRTSST
jgi:ABC-type transporter Mla MlaB component